MPIVNLTQGTPEWLTWRRQGGPGNPFPAALGASDAPIVLGLSEHRDEGDLWLEKAGATEGQPSTHIMEQGHRRERGVLAAYGGIRNVQPEPTCMEHEDCPAILASLDGYLQPQLVVEVKLRGAEEYQLAMAGTLSLSTWVQVQHQLMVLESLGSDPEWLSATVLVVCPQVQDKDFALVSVEPCHGFQEALLEAELTYLWSLKRGEAPNGHRHPLGVKLMQLHPSGFLDPTNAWPEGTTIAQAEAPAQTAGEVLPFAVATTSHVPDAQENGFHVPEVVSPQPDPAPIPAAIVPASAVVMAPTVRTQAESLTIAEGWVATRDEWISRASTLTVATKEDADRAGLLIKEVGRHRRELDEARKKLTKPYRDAEDLVNAKVGEYMAPLESAEAALKAKIRAWTIEDENRQRAEAEAARKAREEYDRQQRAAAAEQARLEAEAKKAGQAPPPPPPPVDPPPAPIVPAASKKKSAVAGVRRTRKVRSKVTDPQLVPRDLCRPDLDLCQALAEARISKDTAEIGQEFSIAPGVVAWVELDVGGGR